MRSGNRVDVDMVDPPILCDQDRAVSARPSAIRADRIFRFQQSLFPRSPSRALPSYTRPVPPVRRSTLARVSLPIPASVPPRRLLSVPGRVGDRGANLFLARSALIVRVAVASAGQQSIADSEGCHLKVLQPLAAAGDHVDAWRFQNAPP